MVDDYGIKASLKEYDVKDCSLKNLSFTSGANLFKIKLEGDYSITIPANESGPGTETISHNLGYEPAVLVFGDINPNDTTERVRLPFAGNVGFIRHYCDIYTDRIVIGVRHKEIPLSNPDYARTFTGHYYIFIDPLFT